MLSTDLKFTLLLSSKFEKFQRKSDYLFNCRCPLCGDSQQHKNKMRGYIYRKSNSLFYKCHNCGTGTTIGSIIKQLDSNLYKEYLLERYTTGENVSHTLVPKLFNIIPIRFGKLNDAIFENAERCDSLPDTHFCKIYLTKRKVPTSLFDKLYFTPNYKKLCDEVYPNHNKEIVNDARLVIPFYDEWNSLCGISGRALTTAKLQLRYVTIKTNDSLNKLIYGLDRVDFKKPIKIVEGPLDSLFLSNCLASGDSSLIQTAKNVSAIEKILIFDNEKRNKDIVKLMKDAIDLGHNVVIWPDNIQGKDINEMVIGGMSLSQIETVISNNTFKNIEAHTKLLFWKRV